MEDYPSNSIIAIIIAAITLIIPLTYILFNNFIDKLYFDRNNRNLTLSSKIFEIYFSFSDRVNSEFALNSLFFALVLIHTNKQKYFCIIAIIFIVLKILLFDFHNFHKNRKQGISWFNFINIYKYYKEVNKVYNNRIPFLAVKFWTSLSIYFIVILSPLFIIESPLNFVDFLTSPIKVVIISTIIFHIFSWITLILIWIPGATLLDEKKMKRNRKKKFCA